MAPVDGKPAFAIISGSGFPGIMKLKSLAVGGVDVRPAPIPKTDAHWNSPSPIFLTNDVPVGNQVVFARLGKAIATTFFLYRITC